MGNDMVLFAIFMIVLIGISIPLGSYMFHVFNFKKTYLDPVFCPVERGIYRILGVDETQETNWKTYTIDLLWFNFIGFIAVILLQVLQGYLPLNPEHFEGVVPFHLAFNTAASFLTNTNWQAYGGESTMSYFTQMTALTVQNFLSAATGLCVAIALIRGLTRKNTDKIGNFWVDMVRYVLWILLPLSIIFALIFVQQGVLQNFSSYVTVQTLEGIKQYIPMGPVASQEAIKLLGTNGGGFFNANSAHPFENPTAFTNFLQMICIFLIPVSLLFTFGKFVEDKKQGYAILGAMLILFVIMFGCIYAGEAIGNPLISQFGISGSSVMEGQEVRFGLGGTTLFTAVTTGASCGAVNAMFDSMTPISGLVPMLQIMLGEVVVGGVGTGFYAMMEYVLMTVFIVGLMVGRTPEYLGKKVESWEMKMAILALLIPSFVILTGSALASVTDAGLVGILNNGPHGLSEMVYAFTSSAGNNGSAFGGLTANTPFYDVALGIAMLIGRFGVIIPMMAIAGSMAGKNTAPAGPGTFSTKSSLFVILLIIVVLIIGALTFFPALALGPIVEHLLMLQGVTF
jgi:potassium-transporting ATPase potassium-binding subunit